MRPIDASRLGHAAKRTNHRPQPVTIRGQCGIYTTMLPDCDNSAAQRPRQAVAGQSAISCRCRSPGYPDRGSSCAGCCGCPREGRRRGSGFPGSPPARPTAAGIRPDAGHDDRARLAAGRRGLAPLGAGQCPTHCSLSRGSVVGAAHVRRGRRSCGGTMIGFPAPTGEDDDRKGDEDPNDPFGARHAPSAPPHFHIMIVLQGMPLLCCEEPRRTLVSRIWIRPQRVHGGSMHNAFAAQMLQWRHRRNEGPVSILGTAANTLRSAMGAMVRLSCSSIPNCARRSRALSRQRHRSNTDELEQWPKWRNH